MPLIERTQQGDQYVLPGTERRTAPGLPYAAEPDGQLTLHFYAPPDPSERRRRQAPSCKPRKDLKSDAGATESTARAAGLFGTRLSFFPTAFEQAAFETP